MKLLLFCFIALATFVNAFAQNDTVWHNVLKKDFLQENTFLNLKKPAYFLNSVFMSDNVIINLDANDIKDIKIEKENSIIDGKEYYGKIMITLKDEKKNNLLSLDEIKMEFTKSKCKKSLFMINGVLLKDKIETYKIFKDYVLSVEITNSKNSENIKNLGLDFEVINVLTKTKENTTQKILIRGKGN
jgi:sRNA-binding regulator protein Hfq